ncbi:MAG TPA: hypothetical protein VGG44_00680 [Tepidisphaeraceae bacterium]
MTGSQVEQLVRETMELTGTAAPEMLNPDSPVLQDSGEGIYLVGLIGGKEVGKSALVNALVGAAITDETSHGPGTETVVAYVHRSRQGEAEELLQRRVPGKFRIVPHDQSKLGGQVLLDLPDIDSRFTSHVELTRRMLRHMLFPIWIQSVEKYADVQPQNLLAKVAAGNDPRNFLFCLNKADQLPADGSAGELAADYGRRIGRVLSLESSPRVFLISARQPGAFDLPELSKLLSREKTADSLAESRDLASRRHQRTLLSWLLDRDLPGQAARLKRLDDEAGELLSQRLGVPLVETTIPAITDNPAYRMVMTDDVFARRVARWPLVNLVHSLMSPVRILIRENAAAGSFFGGAEALVDAHIKIAGGSVTSRVQSAFGQLNQTDPAVAGLYAQRKLWEPREAETAEARLRQEWIETIQRQREVVLSRLSGKVGIIAPLIRGLLTIGALLWFPFIQPVLHTIITAHSAVGTVRDIGILAVEVISAESLLRNTVFLIVWYLLIWSLLRWGTRRRVDKLLIRWRSAAYADDSLNLTTRTLAWIDELLEPIRATRQTTDDLARRVEELRASIGEQSKNAA